MRPIDKGDWPIANNGRKLSFDDWTRAIPILIERTGCYCHICEIRLNLEIEHIKYKDHYENLASVWWNFLLVCRYCNARKGSVRVKGYRQSYIWPHLNNTLLAFAYELDGQVKPRNSLDAHDIARASNLISVYKLSDSVTSNGTPDKRFKRRIEVFKQANDRRLEFRDGKATAEAIVDAVTNTGFFSTWLKVFEDVPEIKQALINCPDFHLAGNVFFDANFLPLPRNGATI